MLIEPADHGAHQPSRQVKASKLEGPAKFPAINGTAQIYVGLLQQLSQVWPAALGLIQSAEFPSHGVLEHLQRVRALESWANAEGPDETPVLYFAAASAWEELHHSTGLGAARPHLEAPKTLKELLFVDITASVEIEVFKARDEVEPVVYCLLDQVPEIVQVGLRIRAQFLVRPLEAALRRRVLQQSDDVSDAHSPGTRALGRSPRRREQVDDACHGLAWDVDACGLQGLGQLVPVHLPTPTPVHPLQDTPQVGATEPGLVEAAQLVAQQHHQLGLGHAR
mmetsp:Transcript_10269/g.23748  ORF Transcript_10269/g.23748 Transcript_10269/m.23748 type:complete len:280 (-) Transcript_10269:1195-2034(-)